MYYIKEGHFSGNVDFKRFVFVKWKFRASLYFSEFFFEQENVVLTNVYDLNIFQRDFGQKMANFETVKTYAFIPFQAVEMYQWTKNNPELNLSSFWSSKIL